MKWLDINPLADFTEAMKIFRRHGDPLAPCPFPAVDGVLYVMIKPFDGADAVRLRELGFSFDASRQAWWSVRDWGGEIVSRQRRLFRQDAQQITDVVRGRAT